VCHSGKVFLMAGPIALASALSRLVEVKCPWCGHAKLVARKPVEYHACPKCKRHFTSPKTAKRK
jgi:ribosomal protein S27E